MPYLPQNGMRIFVQILHMKNGVAFKITRTVQGLLYVCFRENRGCVKGGSFYIQANTVQ
jgi:hypothetical protein